MMATSPVGGCVLESNCREPYAKIVRGELAAQQPKLPPGTVLPYETNRPSHENSNRHVGRVFSCAPQLLRVTEN